MKKIVKLPEKTFNEGITTSVFIFEAGIPQNNKEIFTCYIEEDGLETVKNQGRHDIKGKWQEIEDKWVDIIRKQSGDDSIKWVIPGFENNQHLSYQTPEKEFEIYEEDFKKTVTDYLMYERKIDFNIFSNNLLNKILYSSVIERNNSEVIINLKKEVNDNE